MTSPAPAPAGAAPAAAPACQCPRTRDHLGRIIRVAVTTCPRHGTPAGCECWYLRRGPRFLPVRVAPYCPVHGGLVSNPPAPEDASAPTTIEISRGQRHEIATIAAELTMVKGRHVGTKEAIADLISFWKQYHRNDI